MRSRVTFCAALFAVTLAVYLPALRGGFVWNDPDYVTRPELRDLGGLGRIWTWAPAAWIAGLAAALFALHPVMVESAAWISEQKNTLSTVFYLGAALAYLRWDSDRSAHRPSPGLRPARRPPSTAYWAATLLFLCAILSKSVTASLPAALLVALWWRRGTLGKRDLLPLLPWFATGAAFGLSTGWVERNFIGAQGAEFDLSFLERGLLAGRIVWFYLGHLAWPAELIFIYPRWTVSASDGVPWLYPVGAVALLLALFALRRRTRAPLAAYLFFVGTLFPTLGFFNVYAFRFSFVADHWQYLPSLGPIVLAAGAIVTFGRRMTAAGRPRPATGAESRSLLRLPAAVVWVASALVLAALGVRSWRQTHLYDNLEGFYRTTLAQNPGAWMARNNLGLLLAQAGKLPEAIEHFTAAVQVKPDYADAESNLGAAFLELRRPDEAIGHLENAVRLTPSLVNARVNLGLALREKGRMPESIAQFEEAGRLQPLAAEVFSDLGLAYAQAGDGPKAIAAFQGALRARPGFPPASHGLADELMKAGAALAATGRLEEAVRSFAEAARVDPSRAETHFNLGLALARSGRTPAAELEFRQAAQLDPQDAAIRMALAQALAETGRPQEAAVQAAEAQRLQAARP